FISFCSLLTRPTPTSAVFPYTTLFRSASAPSFTGPSTGLAATTSTPTSRRSPTASTNCSPRTRACPAAARGGAFSGSGAGLPRLSAPYGRQPRDRGLPLRLGRFFGPHPEGQGDRDRHDAEDHAQRDPDRDVHQVDHQHLDPDEHQHQGQAFAEVPERVQDVGQQEVERAKTDRKST